MAFAHRDENEEITRSYRCCCCNTRFEHPDTSDFIQNIEDRFYASRILDNCTYTLKCPNLNCQRLLRLKHELTNDAEHIYFYLMKDGTTTKEFLFELGTNALYFFGTCVTIGIGSVVIVYTVAGASKVLKLFPESSE